MKPLTRNEFCNALKKGLGRAILYVSEYGAQEVQDDILYACLHNLGYDRQLEGSRAPFLLSLIDLTGHEEFYRQHILEALTEATDDWDEYQLTTLIAGFAQRGYEPARKALYAKFEQQRVSDYWLASEQIINIDGLDGLLYVIEILGARLLHDPEFVEDDNMIREAYERFGKETVLSTLSERAESSENVRIYLDQVVSGHKQADTKTRPSPRPEPNLENILSQIEGCEDESMIHYSSFVYLRFGQKANNPDIEYLFSRLLVETRLEQLKRYLWIFRRRVVPRLDNRLFELARSSDKEVQEAALSALANIQDSRVRDFALQLVKEQPQSVCQGAIELFVKNYQWGDDTLIESVLDNCNDPEDIHSIGIDLLDLAETQPYHELANCLSWVYEQTPCAHCRKNAVEILIARNLASEALLLECLWDSYEETRDLARKALDQERV